MEVTREIKYRRGSAGQRGTCRFSLKIKKYKLDLEAALILL